MNTADVEYEDDSLNSEAMQYFFFKAGGDIYAIKANSVSEMVEYQPLTKEIGRASCRERV